MSVLISVENNAERNSIKQLITAAGAGLNKVRNDAASPAINTALSISFFPFSPCAKTLVAYYSPARLKSSKIKSVATNFSLLLFLNSSKKLFKAGVSNSRQSRSHMQHNVIPSGNGKNNQLIMTALVYFYVLTNPSY